MSTKPSVLLIHCDQLRADVLGCYGHPFVKTPNLDRLASRGAVFENAYTQTPVCVPARQNLLTGRHSWELDLLENRPEPEGKFPHLAELLGEAGYQTIALGKMHFHPARTSHGFQVMELSEEIPRRREDDEYLGYLAGKGFGFVREPHGQRHETYYEPQVSALPAEHTTTAWTAERGAAHLRRCAQEKQRFFCKVGFIKPHPPFEPPAAFARMYDPKELPEPPRCAEDLDPKDHYLLLQDKSKWRERTADDKMECLRSRYYGLVTFIDQEIGQICDALDESDVWDETLVVFTADHGELLGDHYHWGKRSFFEGSARIPLLMVWPGHVPAGVRLAGPVVTQDLFTTILSACEVGCPDGVYGVDLLGGVRGEASWPRRSVVGEYGFLEGPGGGSRSPASQGARRAPSLKFMWREDNWKYIYMVNGRREQLFDLSQNRDEVEDLAEKRPDLCREFYGKLVEHYEAQSGNPFVRDGKLPGCDFQRCEALDEPFTFRNFQFPTWPDERPAE